MNNHDGSEKVYPIEAFSIHACEHSPKEVHLLFKLTHIRAPALFRIDNPEGLDKMIAMLIERREEVFGHYPGKS